VNPEPRATSLGGREQVEDQEQYDQCCQVSHERRPFAEWLRQHALRGIITELGVPNDDPRWLELTARAVGLPGA